MVVMVHNQQLLLQVQWPLLATGATLLRFAVLDVTATETAVLRRISCWQHRGAIVSMQDSPAQILVVTNHKSLVA
jgi:hypothetical protein